MFIDSNIQYLYETLKQHLDNLHPHYKWNMLEKEPLTIDLEKLNVTIQNYGFFRSYVLNDKMIMMGEFKMVIPDVVIKTGVLNFINNAIKRDDGFNGDIVNNILCISYAIKYTPEPFKIMALGHNYLISFINVTHFYLILLETLTYYDRQLSYDDFCILYNNAYNRNREFLEKIMK